MNSVGQQKAPEPLSTEEVSRVKNKTQSLMAVTLLLFFFALPAACFGCVSMHRDPGAILFPAIVILGILGTIAAWAKQRALLPDEKKSTFAVLVMGLIVLGVIAFTLFFGSLMSGS